MPSHLSNPWNNAISFLEMHYGDQKLASGSGFLWRTSDKTFLVSNWHNFAGRDPRSGQPISGTGGVPDRMVMTAFRRLSEPDHDGFFDLEWGNVSVELYGSGTDLTNPRWIEHPVHGRNVDIAAIDITHLITGLQIDHVNALEGDAVLEPFASQDVFIVGFPLGLVAGGPIPVWKRGTIATDPTFDPDGLPKVYMDAATRQGMSGSVVIARHIISGKYPKKDGTETTALYARKDRVLGVYSGRLHPDHVQAQLGIVWKRAALEEVIEHGIAPAI